MGKRHRGRPRIDRGEEHEAEKQPGIKLVLKVEKVDKECASPVESDGERKHRHRKKKKKHRHDPDEDFDIKKERRRSRRDVGEPEPSEEEEEENEDVVEEDDEIPPPRKITITTSAIEDEEGTVHVRSRRERKPTTAEPSALQQCLDYLHKLIERKDSMGFFAFPVTDNIAPMYSRIIKNPMDLSTMRAKIDGADYKTVAEYRDDFQLMCDNAMTYNRPDTVYYKGAQKLLAAGLKMMSKDKLIQLRRSLPYMANISDAELGVEHLSEPEHFSEPAEMTSESLHHPHTAEDEDKENSKRTANHSNVYKPEVYGDEEVMEPDEILAQAQDAAKAAAETLTLRQPRSTIGFLRRRDDGSTSFTILNPDNDGIVSEKERVVDLSSAKLAGKLPHGATALPTFKEDKRNMATPVTYLQYGPFSSYAPIYDSTTANLCKEDSDLLLSTYGDETGLQYAKSLQHYVADCGEGSIKMVDNLLDILTGGEHSKTAALIEEHRKQEEERKREEERKKKEEEERLAAEKLAEDAKKPVDFDSLRSLSDLGINTSFLDDYEKLYKTETMDAKLEETSELLTEMNQTQHERLSQQMPENIPNLQPPSDKEMELAGKVTQKLTSLVKQATPSDVVSVQSLRAAMGIKVEPPPPDSASSESNSQSGTQLGLPINLDAMANDLDTDLQDFFEQATTDSDAALQQGCDSPLIRMDADMERMDADNDVITIEDSN